jgi:MYXO-CTERM domain-containing protein
MLGGAPRPAEAQLKASLHAVELAEAVGLTAEVEKLTEARCACALDAPTSPGDDGTGWAALAALGLGLARRRARRG